MSISTAIFARDPSTELSACEPDTNGFAPHPGDPEDAVHIDLWLRDRDIVTAINAHPGGRRRTDYIRTAIRIGVLALQQAEGRIDTESVRNEGDRLIVALENRLQYQDQLRSVLGGTLKDYSIQMTEGLLNVLSGLSSTMETLKKSFALRWMLLPSDLRKLLTTK
jgi:hypothetical protein